jgi:hypothetical protein
MIDLCVVTVHWFDQLDSVWGSDNCPELTGASVRSSVLLIDSIITSPANWGKIFMTTRTEAVAPDNLVNLHAISLRWRVGGLLGAQSAS